MMRVVYAGSALAFGRGGRLLIDRRDHCPCDEGPPDIDAAYRWSITWAASVRTRRSAARTEPYLCVFTWCKACHHQAPADLQTIVDAGRGDVPLKEPLHQLRQFAH